LIRKSNKSNNMQLEEKISKTLLSAEKTLSVAESCTGGLLTHRLTNISGSSGFLTATVVSYSNASKTKLLKVSPALIRKHGAVSLPVAIKMAEGVRRLLNTDFGVAITGIAGPTGGTREKPVGLVFIAVSSRRKTVTEQNVFKGSRIKVKEQSAQRALELLQRLI
jgi:PncC family amidohydrolase